VELLPDDDEEPELPELLPDDDDDPELLAVLPDDGDPELLEPPLEEGNPSLPELLTDDDAAPSDPGSPPPELEHPAPISRPRLAAKTRDVLGFMVGVGAAFPVHGSIISRASSETGSTPGDVPTDGAPPSRSRRSRHLSRTPRWSERARRRHTGMCGI